jgi:hypothetical protein
MKKLFRSVFPEQSEICYSRKSDFIGQYRPHGCVCIGCAKEKFGVQLWRCGVCSKLEREMLCRLQKTRLKSVEKRPSYDEKSERCNACIGTALRY